MRFKLTGNKKDIIGITIKNNDASVALKAGAPCFYEPAPSDSANRGVAVLSSEALADASQGFFAGFNLSATAIGDLGESIVFGYYDYARVLLSTRAASTDVWASYSAIALGDIFKFVTTSGVQAVQRSGAGSTAVNGWWIQAAQTLISQTTQVSTVANGVGNSTAMITQLRVMVRALG